MKNRLHLLHGKLPYSLFLCIILICTTTQISFAHGTVTSPPSRVYTCYLENPENPSSAACIAAVASHGTQPLYDWNEINQGNANSNHTAVIPDGNLASGGRPDKYGGMDQIGSGWVTTPVTAGPYTVTWTNTAPHATAYYDVYITKASWTPDQALTWSDLVLLVRTPPSVAESTVDIPVTLPARTGHHVIYSIWQRSDSPEAFYSTSDIDFGGGGGNGAMDKMVTISDDLEVTNSAIIKKHLVVDSTLTVGQQVLSATDPQLAFQSGSNQQFILKYQETPDKFIIEEVGAGIALEIKNGEIFFPQYANGSVQNLQIDGNGKIINTGPNRSSFNRYNFSLFDDSQGYTVAREGLHLASGSILSGINALLLDNDTASGAASNSTSVNVMRCSKLSKAAAPELIYQINATNTPEDVFAPFSSNSVITAGANIINNDVYLYYLEISFCNDCDFSEVVIME